MHISLGVHVRSTNEQGEQNANVKKEGTDKNAQVASGKVMTDCRYH
jgi:hypothetical protein